MLLLDPSLNSSDLEDIFSGADLSKAPEVSLDIAVPVMPPCVALGSFTWDKLVLIFDISCTDVSFFLLITPGKLTWILTLFGYVNCMEGYRWLSDTESILLHKEYVHEGCISKSEDFGPKPNVIS